MIPLTIQLNLSSFGGPLCYAFREGMQIEVREILSQNPNTRLISTNSQHNLSYSIFYTIVIIPKTKAMLLLSQKNFFASMPLLVHGFSKALLLWKTMTRTSPNLLPVLLYPYQQKSPTYAKFLVGLMGRILLIVEICRLI